MPAGPNRSLMSLALMHLPNEKELVLAGGNSHLVVFTWQDVGGEDSLVEHLSQPFTNVVDIAVCDTWFAIKFKRKRVKLFRVVVDADEFEIREGFKLRLRPFKSPHSTLALSRFRRRQLVVFDASFGSRGEDVDLELFDLKAKRSLALESLGLGGSLVTALAHLSKLRKLLVFDAEARAHLFRFDEKVKAPDRSGLVPLGRVALAGEGFVTRALNTAAQKVLVLGTAAGEVLFFETEKLELRSQAAGLDFVTDLMLCEQKHETVTYVLGRGSKDMAKVVLEPVLGNLVMDRFELQNPIYAKGAG